MIRLKADLHAHSADDPFDSITYSSEMLIDAVSKLNVDVLAIACHRRLVYSCRLAEHARRRNVLLVPAIEQRIDGKHVVMLNPDEAQARAATFGELRDLGRRDAAFLAPHPYYLDPSCLGKRLVEHVDLFDAIEYCSFYCRGINPNRKAAVVARRCGLPMVGTSDCHAFPYSDRTVSWIEVDEISVSGVVEAIRAGRVSVATRPRPVLEVLRMVGYLVRDELFRTRG